MRLPEGLTIETVMEAVEDEMLGLENPGFCLVCGERREGCEPDAREYECYSCGERRVFGAAEVLLMMGGI